ncbi:hypothetical protein N7539_004318 [Penicillium diatomitis]|uniref:Uncharacterized protein n=1 Tax=Penicillium diatomitis TaxID=2819901 RepID=A0A9W9XEJ4_9EURO|nr:uncharacterized protein N7539_004318 [Penicillium diatomitis]KAJ5489428.1 hypothetical protein N7539_004318 [Penicillium diatomitis]
MASSGIVRGSQLAHLYSCQFPEGPVVAGQIGVGAQVDGLPSIPTQVCKTAVVQSPSIVWLGKTLLIWVTAHCSSLL